MFVVLIVSTKLAVLGLLKLKVFWIKDYDVKISVHDVTNKIFSPDSNYIVDADMWPNIGKSSIYHNLNLVRIWTKNRLFSRGGVVLV